MSEVTMSSEDEQQQVYNSDGLPRTPGRNSFLDPNLSGERFIDNMHQDIQYLSDATYSNVARRNRKRAREFSGTPPSRELSHSEKNGFLQLFAATVLQTLLHTCSKFYRLWYRN